MIIGLASAREKVVRAGVKLLQSGLISRTWGNVSCRLSEHRFVITPSGRAYDTLRPEEIITINIHDGNYSGGIAPSSEKDLHAEIYKQREDINFIIHTHQVNASAISTLGVDIPVHDCTAAGLIGNKIYCAAYGLPGSQKLKSAAVKALARGESKAILLACHGAVCFGRDMEEAFLVASELENICSGYTYNRYFEITGREINNDDGFRKCYLNRFDANKGLSEEGSPRKIFNSIRTGDCFTLYTGATVAEPFQVAGDRQFYIGIDTPVGNNEVDSFLPEARLHREIYRCGNNVGAIIHSALPDTLVVSRVVKRLYPLLDDFAQIIGTSARVAHYDGSFQSIRELAVKLKGKNAVLIRGFGALCTGPDKHDAFAAAMILDKGCKAMICATLLGKVKPINPVDTALMRYRYLKTYSRKL